MLKNIGMKTGLAAAVLLLLQACGGDAPGAVAGDSAAAPQQTYEWKLVTAWPKNFPDWVMHRKFLPRR